jgi:branched-chain amino acid aminotransferase
MRAHLERLQRSAKAIDLRLPFSLDEIGNIVVETVRAGGQHDCQIRLYASRGPGSFDANPADCPQSQLYIVIPVAGKPFMEGHPEGATVKASAIPAKPPAYATVKSCNYLPNVLMKKEAGDQDVDLVVSLDDRGFIAEGATANIGIITPDKSLLFPKLEGILRGTTMMRVVDLADQLVQSGDLAGTAFADISPEDVLNAPEAVITGTTMDVTAVREFNGRPIGDGKPGPLFRKLSALLLNDMRHNPDMLTPVFDS